jgi:uncharacterized protein (DUF934 family)
MQILKHREIVEDPWARLAAGESAASGAKVIVDWADWLSRRDELKKHSPNLGVRVPSDVSIEDLGADAAQFALIAVEFPTFRDGRGYSVARLLRERYKFLGELRAVGYVTREQLLFMSRVGFDTFELAPGKSLESALGAFSEFSEVYQATGDGRVPVWRRRRQ